MVGIYSISVPRFVTTLSYSSPVEVMSLLVRNLNSIGAIGCFSSPVIFSKAALRWTSTRRSLSFSGLMSPKLYARA